MDRGLALKLKHYPIAEQRAALEAAGVKVIYDNAEDAILSLRPGNRLAIATPLHILGGTRDKIELTVERIRKAGCQIIDVTTGLVTTGAGVMLMGQALRAIANENRFGDLKKASKKAHETRWKNARERRKETYQEAYETWWNLSLSATQALDRCRELGWSKAAVYGNKEKRIKGLMNDDWEHPKRKAGRPRDPWA